jgi:hypothetical protein
MTPEQTRQMSEMMGQIADMMNKLSGTLGGGMMGPGGTRGTDMAKQMSDMMEQMTQMHRHMEGIMAAPQSVPGTP